MAYTCPQCGATLNQETPLVLICPQCAQRFWVPSAAPAAAPANRGPTFMPEVFEAPSLDYAKQIIVTPEIGTTSEERWAKETPYLVDDIGRFLTLNDQVCLIDFGCGIGRVAKPLIDRYGCRVVGVDSSRSMRAMAIDYVRSEKFAVWSPEELDEHVVRGFRADCCISLWVIQHAFDAKEVAERIARALRPGALFYAMNQICRAVPTDQGWRDDGVDVWEVLRRVFVEESSHPLALEVTTPRLASTTKIQILRNRPAGPSAA